MISWNNKTLIVILGMIVILVILTLFFLLANVEKSKVPVSDPIFQEMVDSLKHQARERDTRARKKEMRWQHEIDSIKYLVNHKHNPQTIYINIDEKVSTSTHIHTDFQLDSILTNYRYIPLTKTGDH